MDWYSGNYHGRWTDALKLRSWSKPLEPKLLELKVELWNLDWYSWTQTLKQNSRCWRLNLCLDCYLDWKQDFEAEFESWLVLWSFGTQTSEWLSRSLDLWNLLTETSGTWSRTLELRPRDLGLVLQNSACSPGPQISETPSKTLTHRPVLLNVKQYFDWKEVSLVFWSSNIWNSGDWAGTPIRVLELKLVLWRSDFWNSKWISGTWTVTLHLWTLPATWSRPLELRTSELEPSYLWLSSGSRTGRGLELWLVFGMVLKSLKENSGTCTWAETLETGGWNMVCYSRALASWDSDLRTWIDTLDLRHLESGSMFCNSEKYSAWYSGNQSATTDLRSWSRTWTSVQVLRNLDWCFGAVAPELGLWCLERWNSDLRIGIWNLRLVCRISKQNSVFRLLKHDSNWHAEPWSRTVEFWPLESKLKRWHLNWSLELGIQTYLK